MRKLRNLLLSLAVCILLCAAASASSLTDLHADITVQGDGSAVMSVRASLSLDETVDTIMIPLGVGATHAQISGVDASVTKDRDGFCYICLEGGFTGTQVLNYSYSMPKDVVQSEECDLLTLTLIPGRWSWPISSFSFTVSMPAVMESFSATYESGYYQDVMTDYMQLRSSAQEFSGTVERELLDQESLTAEVSLPSGYFGSISREISSTALLIFRILILLFWLAAWGYWYFRLRMPGRRAGRRQLPPDGASAGELEPLLYGGEPQPFGILMQWASLGYISIRQHKRSVTINRVMAMGNERRRYEQAFFDMLFAGGTQCSGGRFVTLSSGLEESASRWWSKRIYDRSGGNLLIFRVLLSVAAGLASGLSWSLVFGSLLLMIPGTICGFIAGLAIFRGVRHLARHEYPDAACWIGFPAVFLAVSAFFGGGLTSVAGLLLQLAGGYVIRRGAKRSRKGLELMYQCLGLHRELSGSTKKKLRRQLASDPQYYYTMLPYAEAMGLGKQFSMSFGSIIMEPCDWLMGSTSCTADHFYKRFLKLKSILTGLP